MLDADSVLGWLAGELGESVVVLPYGFKGYRQGWQVGPVKVSAHDERPEMGVCIDIQGEGCEELGVQRLAEMWRELELRLSRLDLALDGAGFTPATLRDEWLAGNVRTRCKVPADAREDRQWRTCGWESRPAGDIFRMGARQSTQYLRCYDERGWTRVELELKGSAAPVAGQQVFAAVLAGSVAAVPLVMVGWVRRFVDFVDRDATGNASRAPLLPFWESFVAGAEKARVVLEGAAPRTVEQVREWVEHQVAPALAVLREVLGPREVWRLVDVGRGRWRSRHRALVRGWAGASV